MNILLLLLHQVRWSIIQFGFWVLSQLLVLLLCIHLLLLGFCYCQATAVACNMNNNENYDSLLLVQLH